VSAKERQVSVGMRYENKEWVVKKVQIKPKKLRGQERINKFPISCGVLSIKSNCYHKIRVSDELNITRHRNPLSF
jgi:hypothetical protein